MEPRLLVVPGLDGHTSLLEAVAPRLFPGLRPLLFDHRHDTAEDGADGLARRALAVLDDDPEGDAPAYVCGESFGGIVALTLAHRYPHRVRGLLLLSAFGYYPALPSYGGELGLLLWQLVGDRLADGILRAARPLGVPGALGLRFPPDLLRVYLGLSAPHMGAYRAKCALSVRFDARPWLAQLTCPTFVLTGTWDPIVPVSAGRALARQIPGARLRQLPGGHLVYVVRADEAGQLIVHWLAEPSTSGGADPGPPLTIRSATAWS